MDSAETVELRVIERMNADLSKERDKYLMALSTYHISSAMQGGTENQNL